MKMLALDNETFLITRERPYPLVVCSSWADGERSAVIPHDGMLLDWIRERLADVEQHFVGHNIAYDFGTLAASWPELLTAIFAAYKAGRVTDTQIRQQLFDIAVGRTLADDGVRGYSLANLYEIIFDKPMPGPGKVDSYRLRYGELYDVDFDAWPDEAVEYSRIDAESTIDIWQAQRDGAAALLRDDAFQTYSAFCLSLISAQGMRTNADRVALLKAEQLEIMQALQPELIETGMLEAKYTGRKPNKVHVGYTKKERPAQERIAKTCAERGVEPMLTKGGEAVKRKGGVPGLEHLSIDRTACHWAQDALMLRRAEYVTAEKILSTYVPFLEAGVDGPVTSRLGLAATGRTTSSTPREPAVGGNQQNAPRKTKRVRKSNLPNVTVTIDPSGGPAKIGTFIELENSPNGVRECFEPRPGKIFLSGDLAGAELHGVAQICKWKLGYSVLGETMNAGRDVHIVLATQLLGRPEADYDDVLASYKQDDPEVIEARQNAKPGNFGFWGAMGVKTFIKTQLREGVHWTFEDATRLRNAWLSTWREAQAYFDAGKYELGPKGRAVVEFYWSKRLRKLRGLSTICNGFFQALVADGAKKACNEVIRRCYVGDASLYLNNTRPVNFVHDELVLETDDKRFDLLAPVVEEFVYTMETEFNELVPDYPTKVDAVLAYKLSKRAKPVFDAEGYLIPWAD